MKKTFNTNKYTRPFLSKNVSALPSNAFTSLRAFAKALSPKVGVKSAKYSALNRFVNLNSVFASASTPTSVKRAIIRALSANKTNSAST